MIKKIFTLNNAQSFGLKYAEVFHHTKENFYSINIDGEKASEEDYRKGLHYSRTADGCRNLVRIYFGVRPNGESTRAKWHKIKR